MPRLVLLFGPICSGKSTLAKSKYKDLHYIKVSDIVKSLSGAHTRSQLQQTSHLDVEIAQELVKVILSKGDCVVDGIRQPSIVDLLLRYINDISSANSLSPKQYTVEMVWLDTPLEICQQRYDTRSREVDATQTFLQSIEKDDQLGLPKIKLLYKNKLQIIKYEEN